MFLVMMMNQMTVQNIGGCLVYRQWTVVHTLCCRWDRQDEEVSQARVGVGQSEDYLDSQTEGDSSYAETVNTVQSVEVADRQFTTVG